jgi:ATP-dependent protease ClpP protease subunit
MTKEEDLYNDQPDKKMIPSGSTISEPQTDYFKEYELGIDSESSIINLSGPIIQGKTLLEITSKIRLLLKLRPKEKANSPINLIMNSEGGSLPETQGLIDYIQSLDVLVNTVCRGSVGGEATELFQSATGKRFMAKRSILKVGVIINSQERL